MITLIKLISYKYNLIRTTTFTVCREQPWCEALAQGAQCPVTVASERASDHDCSCASVISLVTQLVLLWSISPTPTKKGVTAYLRGVTSALTAITGSLVTRQRV